MMDERFSGTKHFWMAVAGDRPKNKKKFLENIELYRPEGDFSSDEQVDHLSELIGIFPFHLVVDETISNELERMRVPPLGNWDQDIGVAWFVPREIIPKKTKNNKTYWIIKATDNTSANTTIKCWGVREKDRIYINRPYLAKLDFSEQWGYSARSVANFKLLG